MAEAGLVSILSGLEGERKLTWIAFLGGACGQGREGEGRGVEEEDLHMVRPLDHWKRKALEWIIR